MGALALLILPLNWLAAAALAALFHELCHYAALILVGTRVYGIRIGSAGAVIETEPMDCRKEMICALAGPAGSLFLLSMIRWIPEIGICAGIQGLFNLMPFFPMDGGRTVRCLLMLICPDRQERIMNLIQCIAAVVIASAGLLSYLYLKIGFGVLLVTFFILGKGLGIKIPCKDGHKRVQ